MAYLLGVLVIAVGVALSIALHEIGHLIPAKRFGVKCTQYMVGFGPTVWSTRRGETEYGLKAVPLGGYVRMLGMFPPKPGEHVRADTTGRWSLMIEQARRDALQEVSEQDADRLFYQRSVPRRLVIMLGGPAMNLIIAVVLMAAIVSGLGLLQTTPAISSVSQCVLPVSAPQDARCGPQDRPAPAAEAGLLPGDRILSFAGKNTSTWDDVRTAIRANGGRAVPVSVERDGRTLDLTVTPILDQRQRLDSNGMPVYAASGTPELEQVGFLGVTPAVARVRQPIADVPALVARALGQTAGVVLKIPQKMVGVVQAAFGGGARDPNGPVSIVGVGRFAGEIGAAEGSAAVPVTMVDRITSWLLLLVSLNLALFVFNLVPLLPLDGGHVAGALWEGLRRQVARVFGRPDPGPVDVARALPLAYGVASVLIGMSVLLIYADIVRPVRLG
jgi:membrane-associated protease RseP (regulator of RpoE activity)